jgi:hypothetical protein
MKGIHCVLQGRPPDEGLVPILRCIAEDLCRFVGWDFPQRGDRGNALVQVGFLCFPSSFQPFTLASWNSVPPVTPPLPLTLFQTDCTSLAL